MSRSEAQKRAWREWGPLPGAVQSPEHGPDFVDPTLAGAWLYVPVLGICLLYESSFVSGVDGALAHQGTIVARRPGVGIRLGTTWAYPAEKLRRVK